MKQHGGEGKSAYMKQSTDSTLKQHGGEGSNTGKKSDSKLLKFGKKHQGPGSNP